MKKAIYTTIALLAAGVASATDYTSSSIISATSDAFPAVGADVDLFETMSGAVHDTVAASVGSFSYSNSTYTYINSVDNYTSNGLNKTITLSSLTNGSSLADSLVLDSYSFISRYDNGVTNNIYMQITVGDQTYTSSVVSYDAAATGGTNTYGVGTFSFEGQNIVLNKDTAYTFQLLNAAGENENSVKYGVAKTNFFTISGVRQGYSIDGLAPSSKA